MTVQKYAIVDGLEVTNIILLDDANDFTPPPGCLLLPVEDDISIGWQKLGNDWVAPEPPPAQEPPSEDADVLAAKYEGVQELVSIGVSESTARRIIGLPVEG